MEGRDAREGHTGGRQRWGEVGPQVGACVRAEALRVLFSGWGVPGPAFRILDPSLQDHPRIPDSGHMGNEWLVGHHKQKHCVRLVTEILTSLCKPGAQRAYPPTQSPGCLPVPRTW